MFFDFGQLVNYYNSQMQLLQNDEVGRGLRALFELPDPDPQGNIVVRSQIEHIRGANNLLVGVIAERFEGNNALCIHSQAKEIYANQAIAYRVLDNRIELAPNEVRCDVLDQGGGQEAVYTELKRCGKSDWERILEKNSHSYEALHQLMQRPIH